MMSPRSFLVTRQNSQHCYPHNNNNCLRSSSPSPSTTPSQTTPRATPAHSPRTSPSHSPLHSPASSPPASSLFSLWRTSTERTEKYAQPARQPPEDDAAKKPERSLQNTERVERAGRAERSYTTETDSRDFPWTQRDPRDSAAVKSPYQTPQTSQTPSTKPPRIQKSLFCLGTPPSSPPPITTSAPDDSRDGTSAAPIMTTSTLRPVTPTSPVQIPVNKAMRRDTGHPKAHHYNYHHRSNRDGWRNFDADSSSAARNRRRTLRDIHSPDAIPPSVAALLAVTAIPPPRASPRSSVSSARSSLHPRPSGSTTSTATTTPATSPKLLTVNAIIGRAQEAEQEFSMSLSKSPLDVLLSPPEDLDDDDDDVSISDSTVESAFSTRAVSLESMPSMPSILSLSSPPSLTDSSYVASTCESSVGTPSPVSRRALGRRARPKRRSLTPVSSPPGPGIASALSARDEKKTSTAHMDHPLSISTLPDSDDIDNLDFRVFAGLPEVAKSSGPASTSSDASATSSTAESSARFPLRPLKSAFKSNLTASLRALRNAARSFSTLNLTSIPPEDFLTRSILTIDPRIPYTDERRPPPLEEEPSAALRRYLNPTTTVRIEPRPSTTQKLSPALASAALARPLSFSEISASLNPSVSSPLPAGVESPSRNAFTASIQMQTYNKTRRSSRSGAHPRLSVSSSSSGAPNSSSSSHRSSSPSSPHNTGLPDERPFPGPRQRELRENSDFIRIAVMEMAMRRVGKLDDRKPGRARLALPPRKTSSRPYMVGDDGVPARWVSVGADE